MLGIILLLSPLVAAFAFALDIYIPTLPTVLKTFHTTQSMLQLTLSVFLITGGFGQLVIGPISDHFGRRPVAMISALIFMLASIACALAPSVGLLIVGRMLQSLGVCGLMVVANAVVRDLYDENDSAQVYSYLNGAIAFSPLFAPIIGGYLAVWLGWRSNFYFLALFALVTLLVICFLLKESLQVQYRQRLNLKVFTHYATLFKNPDFLFYILCASGAVSCFFTFFSLSPYVLINLLHVPEQQFGLYFGILGVTFFVGSLLAGFLVGRMGVEKIIRMGILLLLLGGLCMLLWYEIGGLSKGGFIWPMLFIGTGGSFLIGAGSAGAMAPFPEMAGTASAVLGASEFIVSSIVGFLALLRSVQSDMPLAFVAIVFACLMLIFKLVLTIKR